MNLRHAVLPLLIAAALPATAAQRGFEIRDLATLDRVSSPTVSEDGRRLVFAKRKVDFAANKSSTGLYVEDLFARDAAPPQPLTPAGWSVNTPSFSPDGRTVYFLSAKSGSQQLYAIPATGGTPKQLTAFAADVGSYQLSPDGKRVAFSAETFADCAADLGCSKKRLDQRAANKASGVVFDRMFVRHWDAWNDGRLNRVFVATLPVANKQGAIKPIASATLIGADVIGDVRSGPFVDSAV